MKKENIKELSFRSLFLGIILGLIFGISNSYLGLKIGTTISASIPAVVVSIAFFKLFKQKVSILEHNIVQTIASVGEALAAGVIFTVPALYMLGAALSPFNTILLTILGGMLGILFMIPMRRYVIIKEDGILPFPEGTACAEILKMGQKEAGHGLYALWGLIAGVFYKILTSLNLLVETVSTKLLFLKGTLFSMDLSPALLGVGYIIGPRISSLMFAGGVIAWWVFIPLMATFADIPLDQVSPEKIWADYIRYIGAGAVAAGGILSLAKMIPITFRTVHAGFKEIFHKPTFHPLRTDQDISLKWLLLGSAAIIAFLWAYPPLHMNLVTMLMLVCIGYFFTGVTSITVGLVGSSSSPASGMTITTLLLTALLLVSIGWTERVYLVGVVVMSVVVNVAITLAAATSQDLKTGFLVGATPRKQQIAEMIGLAIPAIGICYTLMLLQKTYGFGSPQLPAPQATLIAIIAEGVIEGNLPIVLVLIGAILGGAAYLCRVAVLPFALGLYLPLSLSTAVMLGGLGALLIRKKGFDEDGVLFASGLVAGDACTGVLVAAATFFGLLPHYSFLGNGLSLATFVLLAGSFIWIHRKRKLC